MTTVLINFNTTLTLKHKLIPHVLAASVIYGLIQIKSFKLSEL